MSRMKLCLSGNEIYANSVEKDNKEIRKNEIRKNESEKEIREEIKQEGSKYMENILKDQSKEKIEKRKLQFKIRRLQPDSVNSKKIKVNRPKKKQMEAVEKLTIKLKKKISAEPAKLRCLARIANGERCRRTRTQQEELCSCHRKHCPYGKINGPLQGKFISIPRKRGPKIRNTKEYKLEELDQGLYQQTDVIKIDTDLFLIDQYGLLFKNDSSCEIVGKRVGNEIHWYI